MQHLVVWRESLATKCLRKFPPRRTYPSPKRSPNIPPREIQYDGNNYKWGYQISDFGQRHQWFKLALDSTQQTRSTKLAADFPDPMASPPGYNFTSEKLVTDYLTALRKHAEQILRYKLPQSALQSTPVEFVITVPAVWSDAAQAKTRACAERAGMGLGSALHMISEPEAAAMNALDAMDLFVFATLFHSR